MEVQLFVIFIILFAALLCNDTKVNFGKDPEIIRKHYITFVCIIFIFQSGLRHLAVGADTYAYYNMFQDVVHIPWTDILQDFVNVYVSGIGKDPGYPLLEKIFQIFFSEYRMFLFFVAILFFTAFGQFIYKNTNHLRDAVFAFILYQALFYFFFSITGLRQTIATAFTLWGFEYIKKKKLIPFLFLILFAATIHKSVLIFLPFYFIANIRQTKLIFTTAIILFPVFMIAKRSFAFLLANISSSNAYMMYAESTLKTGATTFTTLILLIAIFSWLFMGKVLKTYPQSYRFYNAMALAIAFTPLTWVDPGLMRVVQYYSIFMLIFIPTIINSICIKTKSLRTYIYMIIITALILLIIKTTGEYKFLWQEMELGLNYK